MRLSLSFLSALALGGSSIGASVVDAQTPSSYSYDFRASSNHESDGMAGTVRVSGGRARVDVEDRDGDGQYLLVSGDGRVVTVVKPADKSYTIFTADDFAHIASLGMRAAGAVVTMKLRTSSFDTERLGSGGTIAGHATQHVRLVEHWTMDVGAMGFTEPVRQTVETEFYFDPTLTLARNPLMEVVAGAMTVLPSTNAEFAQRADSVRKALVRGTPLRTVITEREENGRSTRTVLEVTRMGTAKVSEAELKVPSGYTRKDGDLGKMKVKL